MFNADPWRQPSHPPRRLPRDPAPLPDAGTPPSVPGAPGGHVAFEELPSRESPAGGRTRQGLRTVSRALRNLFSSTPATPGATPLPDPLRDAVQAAFTDPAARRATDEVVQVLNAGSGRLSPEALAARLQNAFYRLALDQPLRPEVREALMPGLIEALLARGLVPAARHASARACAQRLSLCAVLQRPDPATDRLPSLAARRLVEAALDPDAFARRLEQPRLTADLIDLPHQMGRLLPQDIEQMRHDLHAIAERMGRQNYLPEATLARLRDRLPAITEAMLERNRTFWRRTTPGPTSPRTSGALPISPDERTATAPGGRPLHSLQGAELDAALRAAGRDDAGMDRLSHDLQNFHILHSSAADALAFRQRHGEEVAFLLTDVPRMQGLMAHRRGQQRERLREWERHAQRRD